MLIIDYLIMRADDQALRKYIGSIVSTINHSMMMILENFSMIFT